MSLQEKEAYDLAKCKLAEYLQDSAVCSMDEYVPVSYTHLTLPTNREV